jgi:hypothetical protein
LIDLSGFQEAILITMTLADVTMSAHSEHDSKSSLINSTNLNATAVAEPYLYLEHHFGWMIVTALVIGLAALLGTLGNILVSRTYDDKKMSQIFQFVSFSFRLF